MCGGEDGNAFLLALDVSLGSELVHVVRVHAPVATFAEPKPLLLPGGLHKVLVQRQIVADGILRGETIRYRERLWHKLDKNNNYWLFSVPCGLYSKMLKPHPYF